jgi:hypothetical protein
MFRPGVIDVTATTQSGTHSGISALQGALDVAEWVGGLGLAGLSIAAVVALVQRFRRSTGEERQQLRWLAAISALTGVFLVSTLLTSIGSKAARRARRTTSRSSCSSSASASGSQSRVRWRSSEYHLYDLDIVVKRTVVFTIVAAFITLLYLGALALAAVTSIGAIAGAVIFVLTFNPVRRRAKAIADRVVYGKRATPFEVLSNSRPTSETRTPSTTSSPG